ncbi:MAG: TetR/AcrR family transcriptional regulator [Kineosporiaceae bacterium]
MTPQLRRDAIVDATVAVMLRKGMAATTVRDVADRMGTSSGLVHHYFASMDDLLSAAFDRAAGQDLDGTAAAMADGEGAVGRLRIFFGAYTRADQDWAFQLWLDAWAEAARRPALQATSQRINIAWQQLLARTIRDGVATAEVTCADPDAAAWRILSLLDGLALQAVAHRAAIARSLVVAWSAAHAETELGLPPGTLTQASGRAVDGARSHR